MDEELWKKLGDAARSAKTDRSTVVRDFSRWYIGEDGAELPQRPGPT